MRHICLAILLHLSFAAAPSGVGAQERLPYTLDQLAGLVDSGVFSDERIVFLANRSCLGFQMDEAATRRLRDVGASDRLLASLRGVCVKILSSVDVVPGELEVTVGASRILRARAIGSDSTELANVSFDWASEDTTVAVVSMGGVVQGVAPGATRIVARVPGGPEGGALVRVLEVAAPPDSIARIEQPVKNVTTAAALGVVVPGGGQFYSGKTLKGAIVAAGAAAGLAAGYLITSEKILGEDLTPGDGPNCDALAGTCEFTDVKTERRIEERRQMVIGAAVAGAFWVYGLVDGIRSAKRSQVLPEQQDLEERGLSVELVPVDGFSIAEAGDLQVTLVRIRR